MPRFSGLALALALFAAAPAAADYAYPIRIAVFDYELDDFSAGGPIAGESAEETRRLAEVSALTRRLMAESGLFTVIDASSATDEPVVTHWLRKCNGCEAPIAARLGADMAFVGMFRKISVMEQSLQFQIRDAHSGAVLKLAGTDLRGETDESWRRAATWLVQHRLVEPEQARLGAAPAPAPKAIPIAVIDFDYRDTSGEPRDQTAEHAARLETFMRDLRVDLAASERFHPVEIACAAPPCTAGNTPAPVLIAAAKAAGARLMVYGEISKMSTLVQWGKIEIVDLEADRLVDDKMLTFRGDDDNSWRRAEGFVVGEMKGFASAK